MRIINQTKNIVLAEDVTLAASVSTRAKGLIGKKEFKPGQAMILKPCNSIHTFFMRFPIDVLFVDKNGRIIKASSSLKPWRMTAIYFNAVFVIELPSGTLSATYTCEGDILSIIS